MFEKFSRAAEKAADGVSRRGFLGRFGKAAMATAAGLGAVLAYPKDARARPIAGQCCSNPIGSCRSPKGNCKPVGGGCTGCVWNCGGKIIITPCS